MLAGGRESKDTGILPREGEKRPGGVSLTCVRLIRLEATFHQGLKARFQQVPRDQVPTARPTQGAHGLGALAQQP